MPSGVLPLSTLCENVLLRNHHALRDLGDTRFSLIRRVLMKCTSQQLINLEQLNPILVLEDEPIWLNLLQKDFPLNVQERYTSNVSKIKLFFKQQLDQVGYDYSRLNFDNYIKYQELGNTKKFRLPSKLLYLKYQEDHVRKEEQAIENLRQRMKAIEQSKERNKVVHIDEVIPVPSPGSRFVTLKKQPPARSKLFQKARDETLKRRDYFKNPLTITPASPPVQRPSPIPPKAPPMIKRTTPTPTSSTSIPVRSPPKRESSIFLQQKRPFKRPLASRRATQPITTSETTRILQQGSTNTPGDLPVQQAPPVEEPKPVKKIRLDEYMRKKRLNSNTSETN